MGEKCPLCRRMAPGLDKHHWDYKENVYCFLCRDCHDYIHQGERASMQGLIAITQGVRGLVHDAWVSRAVLLLATRELQHLPFSDRCHPRRSKDKFIGYIKRRYNIPLSKREIDGILPSTRKKDD